MNFILWKQKTRTDQRCTFLKGQLICWTGFSIPGTIYASLSRSASFDPSPLRISNCVLITIIFKRKKLKGLVLFISYLWIPSLTSVEYDDIVACGMWAPVDHYRSVVSSLLRKKLEPFSFWGILMMNISYLLFSFIHASEMYLLLSLCLVFLIWCLIERGSLLNFWYLRP